MSERRRNEKDFEIIAEAGKPKKKKTGKTAEFFLFDFWTGF